MWLQILKEKGYAVEVVMDFLGYGKRPSTSKVSYVGGAFMRLEARKVASFF